MYLKQTKYIYISKKYHYPFLNYFVYIFESKILKNFQKVEGVLELIYFYYSKCHILIRYFKRIKCFFIKSKNGQKRKKKLCRVIKNNFNVYFQKNQLRQKTIRVGVLLFVIRFLLLIVNIMHFDNISIKQAELERKILQIQLVEIVLQNI
ncbi:unnamed protein product [Paramecium sonneborni]|uniref:Transmembrane protein n=1 Tax=Paramecium sonneborni TaxID=65129 RepID=A0A8S1R3A0_9CILI|nr:unnamed protein product [Paramecium sonneborni]